MAKKKTTATKVVEEQEVAEVMEQVLSESQTPTQSYEKSGKDRVTKTPIKNTKPGWEIKDRTYLLLGQQPLVRIVRSSGIYWFDEEKGYERELMLTKNQKTVFVDEMEGVKRPESIIFRDGVLVVPKNKVVLQKLLSLYHPSIGKTFSEYNPVREAKSELNVMELQLEAMNAAHALEISEAEAIMRADIGSEVSKMSSKELKRDLLMFARNNPHLFLELLNDDNVHLRNIGIKATELGIIKLSGDNRTFSWGTNDRKLMTVPFDEHPYSALASWFKTDEGMEVLNSIEKRLG